MRNVALFSLFILVNLTKIPRVSSRHLIVKTGRGTISNQSYQGVDLAFRDLKYNPRISKKRHNNFVGKTTKKEKTVRNQQLKVHIHS